MTTKRMDKADDFQPQSKEIKSQLQRHYCLFFIMAHLLAFILCAFMIYISQPGTCKFLFFTFYFQLLFCFQILQSIFFLLFAKLCIKTKLWSVASGRQPESTRIHDFNHVSFLFATNTIMCILTDQSSERNKGSPQLMEQILIKQKKKCWEKKSQCL